MSDMGWILASRQWYITLLMLKAGYPAIVDYIGHLDAAGTMGKDEFHWPWNGGFP